MSLRLRKATLDDSYFLFRLRNDSQVRTMSSHTLRIARGQHDAWMNQWLRKRISDEGLYIAERRGEGLRIGTGRIERVAGSTQFGAVCMISYSVGRQYRGNGYGLKLVSLLVRRAKRMGYDKIYCHIKRQNTASLLCAQRGGVTHVEFF